jgi:hypothetical protein
MEMSGQPHAPAASSPEKKHQCVLYRNLGGPSSRSGRSGEENFAPCRDALSCSFHKTVYCTAIFLFIFARHSLAFYCNSVQHCDVMTVNFTAKSPSIPLICRGFLHFFVHQFKTGHNRILPYILPMLIDILFLQLDALTYEAETKTFKQEINTFLVARFKTSQRKRYCEQNSSVPHKQ